MARQLDRVLARVAFGRAENQCYRLVYRLSVKVYRAEVRGISRRLAQRLSGNRRKDLIRNGYCVAAEMRTMPIPPAALGVAIAATVPVCSTVFTSFICNSLL